MPTTVTLDDNMIGLGNQVLHNLRQSLWRDLGDRAAACLQEAGFAAGEQVYDAFLNWLPGFAGVDNPTELDATTLGEVLSAFFEALGWGSLEIEQVGGGALVVTAREWAESEPGARAQQPSCYVTSGLFTDFFGRVSSVPVSVMEVECRTSGSSLCRFVAGSPETLDAVFEALASGNSYESALS